MRRVGGVSAGQVISLVAVLGSNQWPLPCETEVVGLRINDMRAWIPIATRTCYHVMSFDITQCHDRTAPKLSQGPLLVPFPLQTSGPYEIARMTACPRSAAR